MRSEDLATRCKWCSYRLDTCRPLWEQQRKCCPDCEHKESGNRVQSHDEAAAARWAEARKADRG